MQRSQTRVSRMIISVEIGNRHYRIKTGEPLDISIPLNFNGAQPNAYGVEPAKSKPCEAGALVGDTRRGGSCNFEQITLIPHCNGTHTECVGHLTHERISVRDCLRDAFIPAALISVEPENADQTGDSYAVGSHETDKLITQKALETALYRLPENNSKFDSSLDLPPGLIVRTLPNSESKLTQTYLEEIPPFFTTEAMAFLIAKNVKHLLVDLPSIDRIFDEGKLSNHRIFWGVGQGSFEIDKNSRMNSTVTELVFIPDTIEDGKYLLNLQIAPFAADASPSRPVLFKLM
jgi:arylformamidase